MGAAQNKKISWSLLFIIGVLFLSGLVMASLALLNPPGVGAVLTVIPKTDDTAFIITNGDFASPTDDYDLMILREGFCAGPGTGASCTNLDLTPFNPPPSYVSGNPGSFSATNDFVQSILFRIWDGGLGDTSTTINVSGTITFNGPVSILGVITDVNTSTASSTRLNNSDVLFHDPAQNPSSPDTAHRDAVVTNLQKAVSRSLDSAGPGTDTVQIVGNKINFSLKASSGSDDFRVILDYGNGLTDFPTGVSFDVKLNITSELGVQIGGSACRRS